MSMTAEVGEEAGRVVGKKQLCGELGWSRMKLDRRLLDDGAFPVKTRGTQAGGWEFDLDAVRAYLQPDAIEPEDEPELAAPPPAAHTGEATARQRRDAAQAQLLEDKIRRSRGELVPVADIRLALSEGVARMSVSLNKMAETLVRRLNLPESAKAVIQQEIDDARRHLVVAMKTLKTGD